MLMQLLALACSVLCLTYLFWRRRVSKLSHINCAPGYPIVGSILHIKRDPHELHKQLIEFATESKYLFVAWIFFNPVLFCGQAKYAEYILSSREHLTKSFFYNFFHSWLGTGLLTSDGDKWKSRRKAITPCFHFSILGSFSSIFLHHTNVLVSKLSDFAKKGETFDIQIPISLATLDAICETAMGVSINAQGQSNSKYVNAVNVAIREQQNRQKQPWFYPELLYSYSPGGRRYFKNLQILHSFTSKVINDKIQQSKHQQPSEKKIFLDLLLHLYGQDKIDIDGIREEVDTFMFEGHDTTSSGLSWTMYCLGRNPNVQKKLAAEIMAAERNEKDSDPIQRIKNLKYLDCVIKEGLRLHPPVSFYARDLQKDAMIDGYIVPRGTMVIVDALSLHTNPDYWVDPQKFSPERFLDESFLQRNPYCYVPFSAGPRNCIGQKFAMLESKIMLYHLILNFEVVSIQCEDEVRGCFEIIHKSDNGIMVKLFPRK